MCPEEILHESIHFGLLRHTGSWNKEKDPEYLRPIGQMATIRLSRGLWEFVRRASSQGFPVRL
jgi:hypothetical protein